MRNHISGAPLPANPALPFAFEIQAGCQVTPTFSPLLAYAIKWNETKDSANAAQIQDGADPTTLLMPDGSNAGLGIFQITSTRIENWQDPLASTLFVISYYLYPAEIYWAYSQGLRGYDLLRAIAAEYNAGRQGAIDGHVLGDVGTFTTYADGLSYSDRCLFHFQNLEKGMMP